MNSAIGITVMRLDASIRFLSQEAGTIVTEQVLQKMAAMTIDTIVGRVRFNPMHRNVGRDPVLMQQQVWLLRRARIHPIHLNFMIRGQMRH